MQTDPIHQNYAGRNLYVCVCVFDNHFKDCNTKNFLFAILHHGGKGFWPSTSIILENCKAAVFNFFLQDIICSLLKLLA